MTQGIRNIVEGCGCVNHVNEVLTMHRGPDFILANISVDFTDPSSAEEIEASIDEMDKKITLARPPGQEGLH